MIRYSYFPGCSLKGISLPYDMSTQSVCRALGVELMELEDWNCCGATAYMSINEFISFAISARNLALAEKTGLDIVAPCSACFTVLNKTNHYLHEDGTLKSKVDECLAAAGLEYRGSIRVRHLLDVVVNDVGSQTIEKEVKTRLEDLKVAPYYGCQIVRPSSDFDHSEFPQSLDRLMESVGAEVTYFPLKTYCCGGSLIASREHAALELIYRLLRCALENGANCIVTTCPMCHTNLEGYQGKVNRKFGSRFNLPVLYFTQVLGLALGLSAADLGLERNIISGEKVLTRYL